MVIHELRERLAGLDADILFLQEVVGVHEGHAARHGNWPAKPQHEFIADTTWHEVAYGRTAIYRHGHHGNAVLSRYPITAQENIDISAHPFESRGLLHCAIRIAENEPVVHCISSSGLSSAGASGKIKTCARDPRDGADGCPAQMSGDFNTGGWANRMLVEALGVHEVFEAVRAARHGPSRPRCRVPPGLYARSRDPRRARSLRAAQAGGCPTTRHWR
jgi:endonuclease/exonuclease/phosphatase family metal-dependent hydrolase